MRIDIKDVFFFTQIQQIFADLKRFIKIKIYVYLLKSF
ncbi:hypothetical protein NU08_1837 [Flavobacterium anhuiense]|uniref:Uncharacterized protein n=1 Tax=Flavobacterium anhuiense TaxID=459526 RepID=A0A444VZI2_9FLAO|nr:hypothetical protein NU08_1837 [Flavobacterium anhuiense]